MAEQQNEYTGQEFNQPVYVNGNPETNPEITVARIPFLLERYEFDKISKGGGFWTNMANILLGGAIGLFINMIAKLIGSKMDNSIVFDTWEVYGFIIALILMGLCYLIDYFVPNEKRRIKNKITEHFEKS